MTQLSDRIISVLSELIVGSPYGRLLGLDFVSAEEDRVCLRLPYRDEVTTLGDTVHGGAIAGLVDAAATASFWASAGIPPGSRGTTIGLTINFASAGRGKDLMATARVLRRGREISTGEVAVVDDDGKEVAFALVTYKLSAPT